MASNYAKQYAKRLDKIEAKYLPKFTRAIRRQISSFISEYEKSGLQAAKMRLDGLVQGSELNTLLKQLYKDAAIQEASYQYGELKEFKAKYKTYGFNEAWTQLIEQLFSSTDVLQVVNDITETTKQQILNAIARGIRDGATVDEIAAEIEGNNVSLNRARLIVRTEAVGASNIGSMMGAMSTGIVYEKKWVTAIDHRTRGMQRTDKFSHVVLNGQKVDMGNPFNNGENIFYPGDKKASAGNICNCRCSLAYIPKRDRNGKIMRYGELVSPTGTINRRLFEIIIGMLLGQIVNGIYEGSF